MTNPASTRRDVQTDRTRTPQTRPRRSALARALPVGSGVIACLLLGAAAAVDGSAAMLVLGAWVALLIVVGMRLTASGRRRPARPPELTLAALDEDGGIGQPQVLRLVETPAASAVVRMRPRG